MAVRFHTQGIHFELQKKNPHKSWLKNCIEAHARVPGSINFIFTSNPLLREMNQKYLKHDYHTDVISFNYSEGDQISGDVFISIDQVHINAKIFNEHFDHELRRVMVHGVLHLIGFDDGKKSEKQLMRKLENDALHLWLKEEDYDSGI